MKLLVTGGAGFIGSNFIRYILKKYPDCKIVNLDLLTYAGNLENLKDVEDNPNYKFVKGDIADKDLVDNLIKDVDIVINFAAESHVDRSILDSVNFIHTNVIGTHNLLEAAKNNGLKRFHHISTDEVFGHLGPEDPPFDENTLYAPRSPYSASKAASDHLVRAYFHTYGLPITISNCSNNYGPYQFPEKLIPLMVVNALAGRQLPIYGDGGQVRDWLYVEDHCEAVQMILKAGQPGETYNIGGGNQPTNLALVETVCEILDKLKPAADPRRKLIQFVADRPGHDRRYAMDSTKIRRELGWQPRHSLEDGLRSTVEWFLAHAVWCAAIQKQIEYRNWMDRNYEKREKPV